MVEACKAVGLPEPEYGADGLFVWITFKRPNSIDNLDTNLGSKTTQKTTQKLSKMQENILAYIAINPTASRKELALHIDNSTEDGIKYNLNRLKELGLIRREWVAKGGYWRVVNGELTI
ncbi:MAG: hypothetical protein J6R28_01290 [Bacteroides sp.]|nr:hypothetical protein [Bacteroides sp.]